MNNILFIFLISFSFFLSCVNQNNINSNKLLLADDWMIQSSTEIKEKGESLSLPEFNPKNWYPVSVPSTVLAALVKNEIYPDPYFGDNLKLIPGYRDGRWLAMKKDSPFYPSWWYRTEFNIPAAWNGENVVLHFDGINYKANIWLNGHQIADTSQVIGMFRRFEFEINPWVKIGETNSLAVEVFGPGRIPDIKYRTKQLEATTGWDDHNPQPPDLNMGLWEDVYITAGGAISLHHPYVVTDLDLPALDVAHLSVSAELTNKSAEEVSGKIVGQIESITFEKEVHLSAGETKVVEFTPDVFQQLNIKNPRIWWPHPVGPQELYDLELKFKIGDKISAKENVRFGIREVSTYINDEGWRGYKVNGKKILIRGGAWMTSDMMLNLTPRRYEALVRYAREANLNTLRSEGFSIRETDEFYNMCDKYGVMVIQQIFGRSIPDEDLAVDLIKDMILRIRNHPSLVHFLGHDETFPTEYLDKKYRELIAKYTPQRTYQPHSGAFHIEDRFKTGGTRTGTLELWTYATPSHYYTHKEDGAWGFAQSGGIGGIIAPYESIRRMMPESAQWPINNETFSFHTVLQGLEYFQLGLSTLEERYGVSEGVEDFCRRGQVMNYESARGMYEAYARNKYDALGITTWKYDAAWPAAMTWQYVDWYLNVGGAYYGAKKACEPLHVQYSYDDHSIYVLNSFYKAFENLKVTARIFNFDMSEKYTNTATVNIDADGKTEAFKIVFPENLSTTYFLDLRLDDDNDNKISDNFYWLSTVPDIQGTKDEIRTAKGWGILKAKPKSIADFTDLLSLPKVQLETRYEIKSDKLENMAVVKIKNPGSSLAFMIKIAVINDKTGDEILPTYWDDNYFCLLPDEEKEVKAKFSQVDLGEGNAVIKVDGWNVE
jgi:exo-1,4-beta-D-glucosaminidase